MAYRKSWSYDDDFICCMEYLRFALGETAAKTIQELIDALFVKLPHISKGSLRMKLQNIKQVSIELGLKDDVPLSPLDQYSAQSKHAFKQAIREIMENDPIKNDPIIISQDPGDTFLDIFMLYQENLNEQVVHERFGEGTITEIQHDSLTVTFADRSARFIYPGAFEKFLRFKNQALQDRMDAFFYELEQKKNKPPYVL